MPNYQEGKIYKMYSLNDPSKVYIGSTCQQLARRKTNHVNNHRLYKKGRYGYTTSFEIIELGNVRIELVEKFPCTDKSELHQREGHWIRNLDCVNKFVAGRNSQDYRIEKRDKIVLKQKEWYRENGDKVKAKAKTYRKENKDHIRDYKKKYREAKRVEIRESGKKYYLDKREEIIRKSREYREANKEKINAWKRTKYVCECGSTVCKGNKSQHEKSKKHQEFQKTTGND